MKETYNPRQKSWDTKQILPSPIYNIDNQVIFLSKNRTFSNIEVARRNGGHAIQRKCPNCFYPELYLFLWREHFCFTSLKQPLKQQIVLFFTYKAGDKVRVPKSWDTKQILLSPIYNINNQVIFFV